MAKSVDEFISFEEGRIIGRCIAQATRSSGMKYIKHKENPTSFNKGQKPANTGKGKGWYDPYKKYRYVSVDGKRIEEHRYIWEQKNGIPKGYVIHHINGNKIDNQIGNLNLMKIEKHISLHHKGKKGNVGMKYNKGEKQ